MLRAILSLFLIISVPAAAEAPAGLREALEARLKEGRSAGLAVTVVRADGSMDELAVGLRDVESREPAAPTMLFRNGSASKMWVAAALLELMRAKGLSIHRPIGELTDELHPSLARVTVSQLLSHSSGLADSANDFGVHDDGALAERVRSGKDFRFFAEPGRVLSYSNPGYDLAGFLLERLSGKPFADGMEALLLKPLGAIRTFYRPTMAMTFPFVLGHQGASLDELAVVRPMPDNSAEWPSGLAWTTAGDSARFSLMLMRGGEAADGGRIVDPSVIAAMTEGRMPIPGTTAGATYGYGLTMRQDEGRTVWEHGGAITGFSSLVTILPESRMAVILLANGEDRRLLEAARDLVLSRYGQKPLLTDGAGWAPPSAADVAGFTRIKGPLAASLIGTWGQSEPALTIEAGPEGPLLIVAGERRGTLRAAGERRLALIGPDGAFRSYIGLVTDAAGKVLYLQQSLRSFVRMPAAGAPRPEL